jgi:hypothetical protein
MSKLQWLVGTSLLALAGLVAGVGAPASADEPKKPEKQDVKPNPAGADVANISLAYQLAEYGRKSKNPEMLVSAARILRQIKTTPGKGDPKVEGDAREEEKAPEPVSLSTQSTNLLDEAKKMAPDDAIVAELVERVNKDKVTRDALNGPRSFSRFLRPGGVHGFGVNFIGHIPADVSVTGNGIAIFTVSAINNEGVLVASDTGPYPHIRWAPAFTRHFTIRVRNDGGGPSGYTMYHN